MELSVGAIQMESKNGDVLRQVGREAAVLVETVVMDPDRAYRIVAAKATSEDEYVPCGATSASSISVVVSRPCYQE